MSRLLIVEDDPTLRTGLEDAFSLEGHDVTTAFDGGTAGTLMLERSFDVIILDVMLPGRGGLELLRDLRAAGVQTPVLMLTARGDENDKVLGLELGADDYVTKPFSLRELTARVKVLLRRRGAAARPERVRSFTIGDATVDLDAFEVRRAGEVAPLTPKEAAMLDLLRRAEGKVVSRARFLSEVWGGGSGPRTVDTHMLKLRQKIEADPKEPVHLVTVHGAGYRLVLAAGL